MWRVRFAFAVLCLLWGSAWLVTGTLPRSQSPWLIAAIRFGIAAVLLLPAALFKTFVLPSGRSLRATLALSVFLIALPAALVIWAQQHLSVPVILVFFAAVPLVILLFLPALHGQTCEDAPIARGALYASIFGLGGVALAVWNPGFSAPILPCSALLLAVGSTALAMIYAKRKLREISSPASALFQLAFAAVLLAVVSLATGRGSRMGWSTQGWTTSEGVALLFLGFLSAAGYAIYFWLLKRIESYQLATIGWITPFVAVLESAVLWRAAPTTEILVGMTVSAGSLAAVMLARAGDDQPLDLRLTD